MESVAAQVLDGMLEGLVLHAIEQEPSHGYGIIKDLEAALGEEPSKNRVYRALRELEEVGLAESEEVTEGSRNRQVYALTESGRQRLEEYRELPAPFKTWLGGLLGIQEDGVSRTREPETTSETASERDVDQEGWVLDRLEELPSDAPVRARHAEYSLERTPGETQWRFVVDRHDPGSYEGAEECPLTFVYLAIHRLLYGAEL